MANQDFGSRIKTLRGQESRPVFAKRFGFSADTIARYESGETFPGADFISKLCNDYNVSADWLIFGVEKNREIESVYQSRLELSPQTNKAQQHEKSGELKD